MQRTLLLVTLIPVWRAHRRGAVAARLLGIFEPHFKSFGGAQVFVDLVIALTLVLVWMWRDAKASGRNIWPWIALTLATGSFGPLFYLLTRKPA